MISLLVRIRFVSASIADTSQPISSGAFISAHSAKWASYCVVVMPPFPTSSMSGSFHPPGPAPPA